MIRADQLMIGDWVEVNGESRQVCAITKKKIGYHITPTGQLHYARLHDVNPLKIDTIEFEPNAFVINGNIILPFNKMITTLEFTDNQFWFGNVFNDMLRVDFDYVHKLQQAIKLVAPLNN